MAWGFGSSILDFDKIWYSFEILQYSVYLVNCSFSTFELGLRDISFEHRHRDAHVSYSNIAGPAM